MSNPLMNSMLRADAMLTAPQTRGDAGRQPADPHAASANPFARTLEQRMNSAPREPERTTERMPERAREPRPERAPERPAEHGTQRGCERPPCTERSAPANQQGRAERLDDRAGNEADPEAKAPTAVADGERIPGDVTAEISAAAQAAAAVPTEPATLAAALPAILALNAAGSADVAMADDGAAIDPNGAKSPLGRLIADVFARAQSDGKGEMNNANATNAPAADLRSVKGEAPAAASFATQLQQQQGVVAGRGSPFAGAPGATQAALQADTASIVPHGTVHIPGVRTESATMPQFQVHTPAGQHVWAEDVGTRVTWLVGRGETKAELVLTPPHLGKLEVSIQVTGDQTTAHFVAASAAARDALEQALPRLREVLQQAGIQLGQANVSTSGEQQARDEATGNHGRGGSYGSGSDDVGTAGMQPVRNFWMQTGAGIVDTFA